MSGMPHHHRLVRSALAGYAALSMFGVTPLLAAETTLRPLLAQLSDRDARDLAFWNRIKASRNAEDYRAYLREFPSGNFAPLARNREAELSGVPAAGTASADGSTGPYDGEWRGTILGCYSKQESRVYAAVRGGRFAASWVNVAQIREDAEGTVDSSGTLRAAGLNGLALNGRVAGNRLNGNYTANSLPLLGPCVSTFALERASANAPPLASARDQAQQAAGFADPQAGERDRQASLDRDRVEIERRRLELDRQKLEVERQRQEVERQRQAAKPVEIESMDREMIAAGNANVRERPDSTSRLIARLQHGDPAEVTGKVRDENWYRVSVNGKQGYVYADLLRPSPPAAARPAPPTTQSAAAPAGAAMSEAQHLAAMRAERRHALLIGNAEYRQLGSLRNPVNDARAMATKLKALGFDAVLRENTTRDQMIAAIDEFGQKLRLGGVGLFFFAGHGVQVRGNNYMMPIDAAPRGEVAVAGAAVSASYVLDYFADANNRFNLMILDACRNNPLQTAFRSAARGLAAIGRAPGGTMVAFATAPDSVAADGDGRNGLFTGEILANIDTPALKIEELFKRVTASVRQRSGGEQIPWVTGSLEGDFYFRLPAAN